MPLQNRSCLEYQGGWKKASGRAGEFALPRDSVLRICTPAGGGYGDATERDAAASERDVREERLAK